MTKKAVVFTTTFYDINNEDGALRRDLALDFSRRVIQSDYPLIVLDGGTDDGKFIEELKSEGAHSYRETQRGLGPSRRESLDYALRFAIKNNIEYLLWTEPEKVDFVKSIDNLVETIDETQSALILPFRPSMFSYPVAQWHSESFGNQLHTDQGYLDSNGNELDQFAGPHLWRREKSPYFQVFDDPSISEVLADLRVEEFKAKYKQLPEPDKQLEIEKAKIDLARSDHMMHMPTCSMILRGERVLSVNIDYTHPYNQTQLETRDQARYNAKRLMQLNALTEQFRLVRALHERGTLNERLERMLKESR